MIPTKLCKPNVIENILAGDTWSGFTFTVPSDIDPDNQLADVVSASIQFRTLKTHRLVYELNSDIESVNGQPAGFPDNIKGTMTFDNTNGWEITANSQILFIDPGVYTWELEIWDTLGIKRTPLRGKINIYQDLNY